jgi:hypothetical protein
MRRGAWLAVLLAASASRAGGADDPLARARTLYNQGQFVAAVSAAEQARLVPARADSADLIAARAYLERYRESSASDDLTNARERLRRLDPQRLAPAERGEFVIGLGEALYFDAAYGAAAEVFLTAIARDDQPFGAREKALDWWATAVDRDARPRSELERQTMYQRIRDRMREELGSHPTSATAAYWIVAAARAQGDLQAAWDAAEAAWVRAPLTINHGTTLRADLDQLMQRAIIPERSKATGQPPDNLRLEWDKFKERWKGEES